MDCSERLDLLNINKPVRYIGNEWNQVKKEPSAVQVHMALAFPDIYEVGMSHLGVKILYHMINEDPRYYAERVFAPWIDREKQLRDSGQNLCSLETGTPLFEFDIIGFSLQYELSYTNVLTILDLGGIPLQRKDRSNMPLVIAGGPSAFNPEPMSDFIDCFFIGDGESSLLEFLALLAESKGKKEEKEELLERVATIKGIYVPHLYNYKKSGRFYHAEPRRANVPAKVTKRVEESLEDAFFPDKIIVPYTEAVHDRISLEIARGCGRGCRFCQAGMIYRPIRERSVERLKELAASLLANTGYNEISLLSLSATDYSNIAQLVSYFTSEYEDLAIGLALPSLRADAFSIGLADQIQKVRKSGLTFAPEAGSQRLRDVINKGITEKDLMDATTAAFKAGWSSIKLYFMIGLPTETIEDIMAIIDLVKKVKDIGKKNATRRPQITVSFSTFIPKPHTPFQWEPLLDKEAIWERQEILKKNLRGRSIKLQWNDWDISMLEALFSRGDMRLGSVLLRAWQKGCRFDGWDEQFERKLWWEALEEAGLPWQDLITCPLGDEERLPWEHIDIGVNKSFLLKELKAAKKGLLTTPCRYGTCHDCGCCDNLAVAVDIIGGKDIEGSH